MEPTTETPTKEIDCNGNVIYKLNGKYHRADGPAVIWSCGTQFWYLNGKYHRADGPAIISATGSQEWWVNDKLHRTDGPAVISATGTQHWYLNGKCYAFKSFCQELNLSSEDILYLKLKYKE